MEKYSDIVKKTKESAKIKSVALIQCELINPSNPLAVARNIEKLYNLAKQIKETSGLYETGITERPYVFTISYKLAKEIDELLNDIKKEA